MALLRILIATEPQPDRAASSREFCPRIGLLKPDGGPKETMARDGPASGKDSRGKRLRRTAVGMPALRASPAQRFPLFPVRRSSPTPIYGNYIE